MRTPIVLIAGAALALPNAVLVSPSHAATDASSAATIKHCSKTRHGVTVRIKMRDNGRYTRIRVSHPKGKGNFREPRLKWVEGAISWSSTPPPDDKGREISGAAIDRRHRLNPSFRTISVADGYSTVRLSAIFKLDSGKSIRLGCRMG